MRGLVYSVITLLLLVPVFMFLAAYLQMEQSKDEATVLKIRGDEIGNYAESIALDVPRILDMTSKRALIAALNYIDVNGTTLDDAKLRVEELMLNRTIYGSNSSFMTSSSLSDWAERMEAIGLLYALQTNVSVLWLDVLPHDSFALNISLRIGVNITDAIGSVRIRRVYEEYELLPLEGFEDPLYPLNTNGFIKRTIAEADGTVSGPAAVDNATLNKWYMPSEDGPSFLDRMEGRVFLSQRYADMSPYTIGLEGFVSLPEISAAGITVDTNKTVVDHLYFNSTHYDAWPVEDSALGWMKLDDAHAALYGVNLLK
ncbi:MAG: hypothetical protein V1787_05495 [Candidatus Micrarchaeota archaeon]